MGGTTFMNTAAQCITTNIRHASVPQNQIYI